MHATNSSHTAVKVMLLDGVLGVLGVLRRRSRCQILRERGGKSNREQKKKPPFIYESKRRIRFIAFSSPSGGRCKLIRISHLANLICTARGNSSSSRLTTGYDVRT